MRTAPPLDVSDGGRRYMSTPLSIPTPRYAYPLDISNPLGIPTPWIPSLPSPPLRRPGIKDTYSIGRDLGPEIPSLHEQTDICENITFPQLHWLAVTRALWSVKLLNRCSTRDEPKY